MVARAAENAARRIVKSWPATRKGVVTAVRASPPRVVVNGREMPYVSSYQTPTVDDLVTYASGPDPICLGQIAT